ncbi:alanine racemase [Burkholderia sp. BCC0405]|uniref:alanine racemase n=1 Tax=Burkholderia sp. BCC0405 TaxID=2676298 RepID=UPI00158A8E7A|nr:alanine racemase [Burkholderia sp. BCC0405]
MTRPLVANIDWHALRSNIHLAKQKVDQGSIMAVVKANAYGHGIKDVIDAFDGIDAFAVSSIDEAVSLREATGKPIVLLEGPFSRAEVDVIAGQQFSPVLHSHEQVEWMLGSPARTTRVWIKLDTGMNRLGFSGDEAEHTIARLEAAGVEVTGVMSHLSNADTPTDPFTAEQYDRFRKLAIAGKHVSISNSAGILRGMSLFREYIRPGIMLYGVSPFATTSAPEIGLKPVMNLTSELIAVRECLPGQRIGYGNETICTSQMRVGVIACGYADGYPRQARPGTPVVVDGRRAALIGRVCMDMLLVDITDIPHAGVGSPVVLWGKELPVERVAACASTIANDLLSGITSRVPRNVLKH